MGNVATITHDRFPKQADILPPGTRLQVMFHYDTAHMLLGTVVRNDIEQPFRMIIALDDGRYVVSAECQYTSL
jgi:hypothetical protein